MFTPTHYFTRGMTVAWSMRDIDMYTDCSLPTLDPFSYVPTGFRVVEFSDGTREIVPADAIALRQPLTVQEVS